MCAADENLCIVWHPVFAAGLFHVTSQKILAFAMRNDGPNSGLCGLQFCWVKLS